MMRNQKIVYGETLCALGEQNPDIVVLEADLGKSTMSCLFGQRFPRRYFEMGIAEQNMTSFAAGLAAAGKIAFTNTFAVFATGRSYDQIRQGICTAGLNVKIVGSGAGLSDYGDGATHQAIEDIAIMRAIPNMTVLVPCDGIETELAVRAAAARPGPVYIRLSRNDMPDVYPVGMPYEIGKPASLREGRDIVIFACGAMVKEGLDAAERLSQEGIEAQVVNVGTLKPLDEEMIRQFAAGKQGVVTAEEHSVIGGLNSAILHALKSVRLPVEEVAVQDLFGQSAQNSGQLMRHYGLTAEDIVNKARIVLKQGQLRQGKKGA